MQSRAGRSSGQDGHVVDHACPTWSGNFEVGQVGQTGRLNHADATSVWWAANTVASTACVAAGN